MKRLLMCSAIVLVAACASTPAYGPAAKSGAMGYESLQIENNRFRGKLPCKTLRKAFT